MSNGTECGCKFTPDQQIGLQNQAKVPPESLLMKGETTSVTLNDKNLPTVSYNKYTPEQFRALLLVIEQDLKGTVKGHEGLMTRGYLNSDRLGVSDTLRAADGTKFDLFGSIMAVASCNPQNAENIYKMLYRFGAMTRQEGADYKPGGALDEIVFKGLWADFTVQRRNDNLKRDQFVQDYWKKIEDQERSEGFFKKFITKGRVEHADKQGRDLEYKERIFLINDAWNSGKFFNVTDKIMQAQEKVTFDKSGVELERDLNITDPRVRAQAHIDAFEKRGAGTFQMILKDRDDKLLPKDLPLTEDPKKSVLSGISTEGVVYTVGGTAVTGGIAYYKRYMLERWYDWVANASMKLKVIGGGAFVSALSLGEAYRAMQAEQTQIKGFWDQKLNNVENTTSAYVSTLHGVKGAIATFIDNAQGQVAATKKAGILAGARVDGQNRLNRAKLYEVDRKTADTVVQDEAIRKFGQR